jgi:light-regulated signal transduction histidine kinase (bacteriophytochrome)
MISGQTLAEHIFLTAQKSMVVLDLDLRVIMANRAFYGTFLLAPEGVKGRPIFELDRAKWNAPEVRHSLESVRSLKSAKPLEFDLFSHDSRTFAGDARYLTTEKPSLEAILIVIEDITEKRIAQQISDRHTAALERSNSDLEQFAYVASHDLQEPLRMIASYTQLLAERYRGKLDADADEFIHFVVDGVHRMQSLIDVLLEYSRADRRPGTFRETDCNDVLAIVQADLQHAIAESSAVITNDPLPVIVAVPQMIGQVFQNLLGNALKFRKPTVPPSIHISASSKGGEWVFFVKDNGIGIPPDQRGRLFQIFQRLHSRAEYPGTGIGLALCKKIIERHGGKLWLESEAQQGSTFFFTIPFKPGEK